MGLSFQNLLGRTGSAGSGGADTGPSSNRSGPSTASTSSRSTGRGSGRVHIGPSPRDTSSSSSSTSLSPSATSSAAATAAAASSSTAFGSDLAAPSPTLARTGGPESYMFMTSSLHHVNKMANERGYRVLALRVVDNHKEVFDILDGTVYNVSNGTKPRHNKHVVLFDSKATALSERFPSTQVGAARSGNGKHPRVLVSFDAWGACACRSGGGSSKIYEYAVFRRIEKVLDSPYPTTKQRPELFRAPCFFPKPDKVRPCRDLADREVKTDLALLDHPKKKPTAKSRIY